jgi:hypothetical protein
MTDDDVKPGEEEEEEPKEGGALSDGVLDAFEETAPVDPLEEDIVDIDALADKEDEDALDYDPDEW